MVNPAQKILNSEQVSAFYHDEFLNDQLQDFTTLLDKHLTGNWSLIDIGGGVGYFAEALHQKFGCTVTVFDNDVKSVDVCNKRGVPSVLGDALSDPQAGTADIVSLNLALHHFVGESFLSTKNL